MIESEEANSEIDTSGRVSVDVALKRVPAVNVIGVRYLPASSLFCGRMICRLAGSLAWRVLD